MASSCHLPNLSTKFRPNLTQRFEILCSQTNKQTNGQTGVKTKPPSTFGGRGNDIEEHLVALPKQFEDYFPLEAEPNRTHNPFGIEISEHELPSGFSNKAGECLLLELSCEET